MTFTPGGPTTIGDVDFLKEQVESMPPAYRIDFRNFVERLFLPSAEYLAFVYSTWITLYQFLQPRTAPTEWLDWLLTEVMGWTLIPTGYPEEFPVSSEPAVLNIGKRRLLQNLHAHYKRRGTVWRSTKTYATFDDRLRDPESGAGIEMLLREFGIHAQVTDAPLYYEGGYYGEYGSEWPLQARIVVLYFEPWETATESFADDYYGNGYLHESPVIVTRDFVVDLAHWSRCAGTIIRVEFEVAQVLDENEAALMLP